MERIWYLPVGAAVVLLALWLALSRHSRSKAARLAYRLVCLMERQMIGPGRGAERKARVISLLHARLPQWTRLFLSEQELDMLIELAVQRMKDLLGGAACIDDTEKTGGRA